MIIAKKSLGQNFITSPDLLKKIAGFLDDPQNKTVIEVGSGPTTLTQAILSRTPKKMIAIEKDERTQSLLDSLSEKNPQFSYQLTDALTVDISALEKKENLLLIGNLPYNISTVLLVQWLKQNTPFSQAILMFQKEVIDRLVAKPNTKAYGRISILTQALCETKKLMMLSPKCFHPAPKVDSALIELRPKNRLSLQEINKLNILSTQAFANRRKRVAKNIQSLFKNIENVFEKKEINLNARAEDLSVETYIALIKDMI
ncbi:MAG: ribosomal RNA small subunit methyltransferase A [Alphaproteobacteria bacterium]|nr:ribosomal RNA small subunit methyltransferase A [Alphaproteobacteria bacterium]